MEGRRYILDCPHLKKFLIDIPSVLFGSISGVTPLNIKGTNFALRYEILLALTVSLVMVGGLFLFLEKTKLGKALRSTADNKDLAEISGIDTLRIESVLLGSLEVD